MIRKPQASTSERELLISTRQRLSRTTLNSEVSGARLSNHTATTDLWELNSGKIFHLKPWEVHLEWCYTPTDNKLSDWRLGTVRDHAHSSIPINFIIWINITLSLSLSLYFFKDISILSLLFFDRQSIYIINNKYTYNFNMHFATV
jgi:hypothetical protein